MKKIFSSLVLIVLIIACKKSELPVQINKEETIISSAKGGGGTTVTVTTTSVYVGSAVYATVNGNVSYSGGGSSIKERGFCYNTSPTPTLANDTARAGSGVGDFNRTIQGLSIATTYYVRAYAINKTGAIYYGNELSFTTLSLGLPGPGVGIVYDIDGNAYNTLTYGTQVWMIENLKTTHFRDGSLIPNVTDNASWSYTSTSTTPAYCDYDNNPANAAEYGRLYNLFAMKDSRGIAPAGWHVPNMTEWQTLLNYLGGGGFSGGRSKEAGFTHWLSPNTGADNSSGFTVLGSGQRAFGTGTFYGLQSRASLWSSSSSYTSGSSANLNVFYWDYNSASNIMTLGGIGGGQNFGFAIRCIKD